ncbi:MAG: hypothetical protein ACRD1T_26735, partial [Acidimicrobiia bacterium]
MVGGGGGGGVGGGLGGADGFGGDAGGDGGDTGEAWMGGGGMTGGATAPEITAGGVCMVATLLHCITATGSRRRSRFLRTSRAASEIKASLNSVDTTAWL